MPLGLKLTVILVLAVRLKHMKIRMELGMMRLLRLVATLPQGLMCTVRFMIV